MAINDALLIASPTFQEALVDKDGSPMAGGTVTCFVDDNRTVLKNWYYQSSNTADSQGKYTFSRLPNPLTLSAAGSVCDINGVDTIPFFYPFDEQNQDTIQKYYITIENYAQTNQITRPNFPYNTSEGAVETFDDIENYIINNVFWRNVGTTTLTDVTQMIVAPSQHDGFRFPDIQFLKNTTGAIDTVNFTQFPLSETQALTGDITPEYYLNHVCTSAQAGEDFKCYQFPISLHVNTLDAVQFTVTIQAKNNGGTSSQESTIYLAILQDLGTGATSPNPVQIWASGITLTSGWKKYTHPGTFPSTAPNGTPVVLSSAGDDALYLQVQMPVDSICNVSFTKPSIYLTDNVIPTNNFSTYDQIDAIINSPRTGDIRTSINSFYYYGWVPMNDSTICNANSESVTIVVPASIGGAFAKQGQDTWSLFNMLWSLCKPYDTGATFNPICQMFDSAGSLANYGLSAYADFTGLKQLQLTRMMGRTMLGTVSTYANYSNLYASGATVTNVGGNILVTVGVSPSKLYTGMPIYFTTSFGGLTLNTIYYIANFNGNNTFNVSTTYANALSGTVIAWSADGSGVYVSSFPGTSTGEYAHAQLVQELAAHNHPGTISGIQVNPINVSAGGTNSISFGGTLAGVSLPSQGGNATFPSGVPFNVTQPSTYYNMYIKL